jgi:hypothetical protein
MLDLVHSAAILHYGPLVGYALLAVAAIPWALTRAPLPGWFWALCLALLVLVALQVAAGILLILVGSRPRQSLHLVYGLLVLAVGLIQYGLRPAGFFRRVFARELTWGEARTLVLVSLTQAALIARAVMTGWGSQR